MASLYPGAPAAVTASAVPSKPAAAPARTTTKKTAAPTTFDWNAWMNKLSTAQNVDYSGLAYTASRRAASETAATIAGIKSLQDAATARGRLYAGQQGQLGLAASHYLEGLDLGGQTAQDYANAAAAQRAAAAGYSGGLQQTVSDAAASVQANLAAIGSPQTALNQGGAAGNVLYGLGGNLPAQTLDVVGPTVAAGLRALPAQTLGYGQTLAAGALAQGQAEAAKLTPDIVTARAQQGALAAKYLDTLSQQAQAAGQDRLANLFKLASLAQDQEATAATAKYRQDTLEAKTTDATAKASLINVGVSKLNGYLSHADGTPALDKNGKTIPVTATGAAAKPYRYQDSYGRQIQLNPDGTQQVLTEGHWTDSAGTTWRVGLDNKQTLVSSKPVTPPTPHTEIRTIGKQQWLIDKATGARIQYIGPAPASTRAPRVPSAPTTKKINGVTYEWSKKPDGSMGWVKSDLPVATTTTKAPGPFPNLTKAQVVHLRSGIAAAFYGVSEQKDTSGKVTRAALPPVDYQAAIEHAVRAGYSRAGATKMANRFYKRGQRGRPGRPGRPGAKPAYEAGIASGKLAGPPAPGYR